MNAIIPKNSTALSTKNARSRKIRTLISGTAVRSSTRTNTASTARPPRMQAQVHPLDPAPGVGLLQAEHGQAHADRDQHGADQ